MTEGSGFFHFMHVPNIHIHSAEQPANQPEIKQWVNQSVRWGIIQPFQSLRAVARGHNKKWLGNLDCNIEKGCDGCTH